MQGGDRMSNQEAIALLRNLEDSLDSYCELNEEGKTAFRMAIEALSCSEFPNSSDTIYRQTAIAHAVPLNLFGREVMMVSVSELENLPSAQPEQRWIPCSERLPEAEDCPMDCLVTRKSKYIGNYTDMAVCEKNEMWTHEDWDAIVLGDVKDGKSTGLISTRDDDIIAWMPLPEPYKERRER